MSVIEARHDLSDVPGSFGWDGACGTSWYVNPTEEMIGILMIQRVPDQLTFFEIEPDFWT